VPATSNIVFLAACATLACGDPSRGPSPDDPSAASPSVSPHTGATSGEVSELAARAILGDGLRRAGLRIVADVARPVAGATVVLDGWDPARAVGFEYQATAAGDPPLAPAIRAALGERVLVIGPCDEATLRAELDAFVARIAAQP
jgi:hypothetical protein